MRETQRADAKLGGYFFFFLPAVSAALALTVATGRADEAIRILCPTWPGYAPIFVANDLGYFKDLGITVTMNFDDDRSDGLGSVPEAGDADHAVVPLRGHRARQRPEPSSVDGRLLLDQAVERDRSE